MMPHRPPLAPAKTRVRPVLERGAGAEIHSLQAHPGGWSFAPQARPSSRPCPCVVATGFSTSAAVSVMPRSSWRNSSALPGALTASIAATHFSIMRALKCAALGLANVCFVRADAEIALPTNQYDFRLRAVRHMFFANPVAGLRNMRKALRPGGRMVHIVWRERADNPWLSMAKDIVLRFLPPPAGRPDLRSRAVFDVERDCRPGDDDCRGYDEIEFRRVDAPVVVGKDVKRCHRFPTGDRPAERYSGRPRPGH